MDINSDELGGIISTSGHLKEVDGLRAVAVLSVMAFHYQKSALPFGYLGVDVFFAISGYVITRSIMTRADEGRFTINDFFVRRLKRLFPALALVTITTALVSALLLPRSTAMVTGATALLGVSNIALWYAGHDYFATSAEWNPLIHTWSLGVEEQFYLFFPFLLNAFRRNARLAAVVLGALGLVSLATYFIVWGSRPTAAFYLSIFRLWELLGGALIYLSHRAYPTITALPFRGRLHYVLLATLLITMFATGLGESLATFLCVVTSCGLLFLSGRSGRPNVLLCHPVSQAIGEISYSLYLWHWPVAVFAKLLVGAVWVLPVYVMMTAMTASLSYALVERPLRRATWSWLPGANYFGIPAVAAMSLALVGLLFAARFALYLGPRPALETTFLVSSACHIPGRDGLTTCLRENTSRNGTVWLVGDSHAGNFLLALRGASARLGIGLQYLTGRSLYNSLTNQCAKLGCPEGDAKDLLARMATVAAPGDIAVISFTREFLQTDAGLVGTFRASLESLVGDMAKTGIKVILVEDIPKVCEDDGAYFKSALRPEVCRVPMAKSRQERRVLSDIYQDIKRRHDVLILDPHDMLCDPPGTKDPICGNWLGNELIYVDASPHLSARVSAGFADYFHEELRRLLPPDRAQQQRRP